MGYSERSDVGYKIEGWPVQFLPVASPLDNEALAQAIDVNIAEPGEPAFMARSLSAAHVVAIALKLGRLKDLVRIQAFVEQDAVDSASLKNVLERHNLVEAWKSFCLKAGVRNPL